MASYIIISMYICCNCWLFGRSIQLNSKKSRVLFVMSTLGFMCMLMALRREDIGNDTRAYINFFRQMCDGDYLSDHRIEIGFRCLTIVISRITHNNIVFMSIIVCLAFIPQVLFLKRLVYRVDFAVILFWLLLCIRICSVQRQGIAMGVIAIGYLRLIKRGKKGTFEYVVCCIIASLFHNSAIVMLILPFLSIMKITKKIGWWVIGSSFLLVFTNLIPRIYVLIVGDYYSKYSFVQSGWLASGFNMILGCLAFFLSQNLDSKKNQEKKILEREYLGVHSIFCDKEINMLKWSAVLFAVTSILAVNVGIIGRISLYFIPFIIVLFSNVFDDKNTNSIYEKITIGALIGYNILSLVIRPEWNSFFPYYFFWK